MIPPTNTLAPTSSRLPLCEWVDSTPLGASGSTIQGRVARSFSPAKCRPSPNIYPGTVGTLDRYFEMISPFGNPTTENACAKIIIDMGTCRSGEINAYVQVTAYSEFDPFDMSQGYLGDIGDAQLYTQFEFQLQPHEEFYIVGQQIHGIQTDENGENCIFSVLVEVDANICDSLTTRPTERRTVSPTISQVPSMVPTTLSPTTSFAPTVPLSSLCEWIESPSMGIIGPDYTRSYWSIVIPNYLLVSKYLSWDHRFE